MCYNIDCGVHYPFDPIVHSTSIASEGVNCIVTVEDFLADNPTNLFVLELGQQFAADARALYLRTSPSNTWPIMDKYGNTVHADQIARAIACRERDGCRALKGAGKTCPARACQFQMRVCHDPNRFVVLCCLPRSVYANNFYAPVPPAE